MSGTAKRTEFLARAIVNRLEDRGLVEFRDAESAIVVVAKALEENFVTADAIELQARNRVGERASDEKVEVEMRRIATEKGFIL